MSAAKHTVQDPGSLKSCGGLPQRLNLMLGDEPAMTNRTNLSREGATSRARTEVYLLAHLG